MTITSTAVSISYIGDGTTTSFAVPFAFFGPDEIAVYSVTTAGLYTLLSRGIDYNVTGGNDATGAIVAVLAPAIGLTWTIRRRTARTQQVDYIDFDPFPAGTTETALDRLTAQSQENDESIGRTLRAPIGEAGIAQLPIASLRASKYLGFDSSGTPTTLAQPVGSSAVSGAMAPVILSASTAAALALLGGLSASAAGLPVYNVKALGAAGDNVTNDYTVIQNALNACAAAGGGIVFLPPTGKPYLIGTGLSVANGTILLGADTWLFAGTTATILQWSAQGTWIRCTDTVNPAISLNGHGASVRGLCLIYTQPVPGGSFTPTTYPYAISMNVSYSVIDHVFILGATHGITVNLTTGSGGGTGSRITNCLISAFRVGLQINNVNDTMVFENLWIENQYYDVTTVVVNYLLANLVGIECHYCDNSYFSQIQIYQARYGITVTDQTCQTVTHSLYNCALSGIDFNDCVAAFAVAATTTTVVAQFLNVLAQSDFTTAGLMFSFGSDNADITMCNVRVPVASAGVILLGNGTGGKLLLTNFECLTYSNITAGQACITVNTGATATIHGEQITKHAGNGLTINGAYVRTGSAGFWMPFGAAVSSTGTAAAVQVGVSSVADPIAMGAMQGRIRGTINVTTAQASGTITVAFNGFPAIAATGIPASTTGIKSFDSGWIDFFQAPPSAIGVLQQTSTTGVIADYSGVMFEWR
jgi:hypothetical protein